MREQSQNARSTFPMWGILLLLVFTVGIIALIAIPNIVKPRGIHSGNACFNNLRVIDGGANQFALEHSLSGGSRINFSDELIPYLGSGGKGKMPVCPLGGAYSLKKIGDAPTCSLGTNVTSAHALD